jgi:hypothetical protein
MTASALDMRWFWSLRVNRNSEIKGCKALVLMYPR